MFFVRPQAAHPIAAIALGGYTFFMGKGKGSNGTCTPIGSALGEQGTLAERYGDDLPSIQRRLGEAVRRDGSTPQLAELTAPASEEELEALARRYGSSLEGKYGQLTQRRQARNRSEARMDKLDAFSRMVDMNVISGSALVQFSRLAGMVLRHHPDPRARSRAAEILIMVNQRGAIEMAGKWFAMVKSQGFSRDELLSACQEGLLEAAEERDQKRRRLWKEYDQAKAVWLAGGGAESGDREPMPPTEEDVKVFDPEKASFYTYAKLKMYMRCQRYVEQNSGSRFGLPIPTALYHQLSTIIQERAAIEDTGQEATVEALLDRPRLNKTLRPELPLSDKEKIKLRKELLEELGHVPSSEQLDAKVREMRRADLEEKLQLANRHQVSLNKVMKGSESASEFEQFLQDDRQDTAREAIEEIEGINPGVVAALQEALSPEESRYLGALDLKEILPGQRPADNAAALAEREGVSKDHVLKVLSAGRKKIRSCLKAEGGRLVPVKPQA